MTPPLPSPEPQAPVPLLTTRQALARAIAAIPKTPFPSAADIEAMMERVEGGHRVDGTYYADLEVAGIARRVAALRIQRALVRGYAAPVRLARAVSAWRAWHAGDRCCVWCEQPIARPTDAFELGGRLMHFGACQDEFDGFTARPGGVDA